MMPTNVRAYSFFQSMCPPVPLSVPLDRGCAIRVGLQRAALKPYKSRLFCTYGPILPYWVYRSGDAEVPFRGPGLNRLLLIESVEPWLMPMT